MPRSCIDLAVGGLVLGAVALAGWPAVAQNSLNSAPPSAAKVSGSDPAGDASGAIRSLSSTDPTGPMDHTKVRVPPLGGHEVRTGGAPAGTSSR